MYPEQPFCGKTLGFGFQTEECTRNKNSILCIEDVRTDGEMVEVKKHTQKKKNQTKVNDLWNITLFFKSVP